MKKLRVLTITVLVATLFLSAYAITRKSTQYKPRAFRMTQVESSITPDGTRVRNIRVRLTNAAGVWKEFVLNQSTGAATINAANTEGNYTLKDSRLRLTGGGVQAMPLEAYSTATYKHHPSLNRTEDVLGFKCYVLHTDRGDGDYVEEWIAPQFGRVPIKLLIHHAEGDTLIEPLSVEFAEVSEEDLKLPDMPIQYDLLEKRIEAAEQHGQRGMADSLKRLLPKQQ